MNEHLQNILSIIQHAEHLSDEEKTALLKEAKATDKELEITAFKLERTEKVKHTTAVLLEETIEELEQKRKVVEAQNKELEIEAALEKVRSRSLAMHKSNELWEVIAVVFEKFQELNFAIDGAAFITTFIEGTREQNAWVAGNDSQPYPTSLRLPYLDSPVINDIWQAKESGLDFLSKTYSFEEKNHWLRYAFENTGLKSMTDEWKNWILEQPYLTQTLAFGKTSMIGIHFHHQKTLTETEVDILKRFSKVFDQAYIRFLDLQKAEAQARESQIQLALERVRARTMAMQKSEELKDAAMIMFQQIQALDVTVFASGFNIWDDDRKAATAWMAGGEGEEGITPPFKTSSTEGIFFSIHEAAQRGESLFVREQGGKELESHIRYMAGIPVFKEFAEKMAQADSSFFPTFQIIHCAFFSKGYLMFISYEPLPEAHDIFKRFAKVFEQTYTRFLDLQKAEAHAREAQIELGLERVRARAMAMHGSDELKELVKTLFEELIRVDVNLSACLISTFDISTLDERSWMFHPITREPYVIRVPYNEQPFYHEMLRAWKERNTAWNYCLKGEIKVKWHDFLFADTEFALLPQSVIDEMRRPDKVFFTASYYSYGAIQVASLEPFPAQSIDIIQRFSKVFDSSYTRFLDLQKAEAQARESQIELALERIRARTMAMQHSDELSETASLLFEQVQSFGVALWSCGFNISEKGEKECTSFITRGGKMLPPVKVPLTENSSMQLIYEFRERDVDFWYKEMAGEEIKELLSYIARQRNKNNLGDNQFLTGVALPAFQIAHFVNFSHGNLMFITLEAHPEMHDIFKRFGKVFQQTYTRFLDLQKAEAQAREGQIELALERVRARTMAMQRSDELREAVLVIYEQLQQLNFESKACNIIIIDKESGSAQYWVSGFSKEIFPESYTVPYLNHPYQDELLEPWKRGDKYVVYEYTGTMKQNFDEIFFTKTEFRNVPEDAKKVMTGLESVMLSTAFISCGALQALGAEPLSEEDANILQRFAKVFEQTYTRFLDLQKAEAQTRESQIQLALERVRARTMAMQHSDELMDAASLLFKQIADLGTRQWSSGFDIWNANEVSAVAWMSNPDGSMGKPFNVPYSEDPFFKKIYEARQTGEDFFVMESSGKELEETYQYLFNLPEAKKHFDGVKSLGFQMPTFQITHCAFFSHGYLMFITFEAAPEMWDIFKRFAKVFEQTYTRFLDLQTAEAQARESQIQLALERVRARTMAMQRSEELSETAVEMFNQVKALDVHTFSCGFHIFEKEEMAVTEWMSDPGGSYGVTNKIPLTEDLLFIRIREARQKNLDFVVLESSGKELQETIRYMSDLPGRKEVMDKFLNSGFQLPTFQFTHCAFFSQGYLMFITIESAPEAHDIFKRFAKVFEQTYTRFLDLQKAEAQTRESQIQLALERVRARTMAMQKSNELAEAARVLYEEFRTLNINTFLCGYCFYKEEQDKQTVWVTLPDGSLIPDFMDFPITGDHVLNKRYKDWKQKKPLHVLEMQGEENKEHHRFLASKVSDQTANEIFAQIPDRIIAYCANFSTGYLFIIATEFLTTEEEDVIIRFAKVFELTYTRFSDLKQAEEQARESQIQLALERVRARTMAMQKSEELQDTALLLFQQVNSLGVTHWACGFNIYDNDRKTTTSWMGSDFGKGIASSFKIPLDEHIFKTIYEASQSGESLYILEIKSGEIEAHYRYMFTLPVAGDRLKAFVASGGVLPAIQIAHAAFFPQGYLMFITQEQVPEMWNIYNRFAKVFEQTYTRFLDLQKAEAQAREARIETALEKVRSRTMAMQKSEELQDTAFILFQQIQALDISIFICGFNIWDDDRKAATAWMARKDGIAPPFKTSSAEDVFFHIHEAAQRGESLFVREQGGEELETHYGYLATIPLFKEVVEQMAQAGFYLPTFQIMHCAYFTQGYLMFISYGPVPEAHDIFKRFAKVFEQTYTRFLDLQKAEAQARESQIQLALERVRARTMAMQKSDELNELIKILFSELRHLEISLDRCLIMTYDPQTLDSTWWMASRDDISYKTGLLVPYHTNSPQLAYIKGWQERKEKWTYLLEGDEKKEWDEFLFGYTALAKLPDEVIAGMRNLEKNFSSASFKSFGCLTTGSFEPLADEAFDILIRFTQVFDQAYTRFLDLQTAEAQAREAQIELGLERVRARAMAMQGSNELKQLIATVYTELTKLDIALVRCLIWIMDSEDFSSRLWMYNPESQPVSFYVPYHENPPYLAFVKAWKERNISWQYDLRGSVKKDWDEFVFNNTEMKHLPEPVKKGMQATERTMLAASFHNFGCLQTAGAETLRQEQLDILNRFARVFDLTYTRFADLKKAEAQVLEAIKRASVDRVRAEIASMRTTKDLERITPLIWNELTTLGVPFIRCGVFIMDEETEQVQSFLSTPDGKAIAGFRLPYFATEQSTNIVTHWQQKKKFRDHMDETAFAEYAKNLMSRGAITSGEKYLTENRPTDLYLHFLPFLQGMLYVGNAESLSDDGLQLAQNLADAFSTAYARYEDFNKLESAKQQVEKTLVDLKQTQAQLVQSEKMASLGELTAGIAHEIQNPLNFVNNFSEVSNELIEEMNDELDKGDIKEAKAIAADIQQNLEKINHHGKRADAIVKGMLQHSRSSSATKEPTDINKLADEYLRLAYHGLRAKDNSFNATLNTDYDNTISNVNIIPQDIGRVILNLITNAFYTVTEKKKQQGNGYEPTVTVSTKNNGDHVAISVRDNGNGIPGKVVDKIFQPFFTTKPTGQGTGLGLSLAYDIIKTHNGDLKVETKEGEGSEFIIQLPV